nr:orotidine-5'-phosphate decarboxylase [Microbacterium halimionae]
MQSAVAERGRLCVGIDPHESVLSNWGLAASAEGAREFSMRVIDAAAGRVSVVKPQVAFFERFGATGYLALEEVLASARDAGLLVIADAKRGDIGSTMAAYAEAWLTPGSPLEADALTVSPYLGVGALTESMTFALEHGKGLFVLAATSNPEARDVQGAAFSDAESLASRVLDDVWEFNSRTSAPDTWGSIGVVIGATVNRVRFGIGGAIAPIAPVLAPGFGAQGAKLSEIDDIFAELSPVVLASESRGIVSGGPNEIVSRIEARTAELRGERS